MHAFRKPLLVLASLSLLNTPTSLAQTAERITEAQPKSTGHTSPLTRIAALTRNKHAEDEHFGDGAITDFGLSDPHWLDKFSRNSKAKSEADTVQSLSGSPDKRELPLSPEALEVSKDMNIVPLLESLWSLKHSYLITRGEAKHLDLVGVRLELVETMMLSFLEIRDVAASLDVEIAKYDSQATYLEGRRDKGIRYNNIINFTSGGAMQMVGSAIQIGTKTAVQNGGNELEVVQAALQTLIASYALKQLKGPVRSVERNPNMLAPILGRMPVDYNKYPPAVWQYLNDKPPGSTETRRELLIRHWVKLGRIPAPGKGGSDKVLDGLAGTIPLDKGVTIDLLRDRIPMMTDVRSVVTTSTQPLREIMSFIRRP